MLYLSGSVPSDLVLGQRLKEAGVGIMAQPGMGNSALSVSEWTWAADNGCFKAGWQPEPWLKWLDSRRGFPRNLWAVVPDKVGDCVETRAMWDQWSGEVVSRGFRAAYVLQDGCTVGDVPWSETSAVFIGGSTAWKFSDRVRSIIREARVRGIWCHMGRVNSRRRIMYASEIGCDSVDGTFLAFGPNVNAAHLAVWLHRVATETPQNLFDVFGGISE